jgi:hypothetical protein
MAAVIAAVAAVVVLYALVSSSIAPSSSTRVVTYTYGLSNSGSCPGPSGCFVPQGTVTTTELAPATPSSTPQPSTQAFLILAAIILVVAGIGLLATLTKRSKTAITEKSSSTARKPALSDSRFLKFQRCAYYFPANRSLDEGWPEDTPVKRTMRLPSGALRSFESSSQILRSSSIGPTTCSTVHEGADVERRL